MSQRSPFNDRYKVDQKGKTRKSAAGAKPKREHGTSAAVPVKKAPAKKQGLFSRGSGARSQAALIEQRPEIRRLRRYWWWLWGGAVGVAIIIVFVGPQERAFPWIRYVVYVLWALWAAAMAGAFYLEFVPIKKAREAAIAEAKAKKGSGKGPGKGSGKGSGNGSGGATGSSGGAGASGDTSGTASGGSSDADAPTAATPVTGAATRLGARVRGLFGGGSKSEEPPVSDNDEAERAAHDASGGDDTE
jgi:hypothetical protein